MGETGNNGSLNVDYEESLRLRRLKAEDDLGLYRFGQTSGTEHQNFDQNYDAINSFSQNGVGTHMVRGKRRAFISRNTTHGI